MTVSQPSSQTAIIQDLDNRVSVLEKNRSLNRDENGLPEFESGVNIGDGPGQVIIGPGGPAAPTNLVLTPGAVFNNSYVDIEWTPQPAFDEYRVQVTDDGTGIPFTITVVSGSSVRVNFLNPNTNYNVGVRSVDSINRVSTELSGSFLSLGDTTNPSQVTNFVLVAGYQSVVATWDELTDEDVKWARGLYEVQIDTVNTFDSVNLKTARVSATIASWTDLDNEQIYYGRVKAIDSSGNEGPYSTVDSATTATELGRDFTLNPILETEIADDAVSTPKLQANSITSGKLVTGTAVITETAQIADAIINTAKVISLDAAKISFGEMSGDRIQANTLSVEKLTSSTLSAKTITLGTGGMLLANGTAGSLYLSSDGLELFDQPNGAGNRTVFLDADTGNGLFTGVVDVSGSYGGQVVQSTVSGGVMDYISDGSIVGRISANNVGSGALLIRYGDVDPNVVQSGNATIRMSDWYTKLMSGINSNNVETSIAMTTSETSGSSNIIYTSGEHLILGDRISLGAAQVDVSGDITVDDLYQGPRIWLNSPVSPRIEMEWTSDYDFGILPSGTSFGSVTIQIGRTSNDIVLGGPVEAQRGIVVRTVTGVAPPQGTGSIKTYALSGEPGLSTYGGTSSSRNQITFLNTNGTVGSIATSGSSTVYNTSSDRRLKRLDGPMIGALDLIRVIPVHQGAFLSNPDEDRALIVADELQPFIPEAVTGEPNGEEMQQVDFSTLVPYLVASIQDLERMVNG